MMTTPQPMPAEYLHSARCLAHAMICAIENLRDEEGSGAHDFRLQAQAGIPLAWADEYLASGTADCLCHTWDIAQAGPNGQHWQATCACGWVSHPMGNAHSAVRRAVKHADQAITDAWALVQA